jgi:hypothetical protein
MHKEEPKPRAHPHLLGRASKRHMVGVSSASQDDDDSDDDDEGTLGKALHRGQAELEALEENLAAEEDRLQVCYNLRAYLASCTSPVPGKVCKCIHEGKWRYYVTYRHALFVACHYNVQPILAAQAETLCMCIHLT